MLFERFSRMRKRNGWSARKTGGTDEAPQFHMLAPDYNPETVNHGRKEYVRGIVHTNSIESFWNILKRGIIGSYHKVSVKWLPRYLNEFCYRFSHTHGGNSVGLWKQILESGTHRVNGK